MKKWKIRTKTGKNPYFLKFRMWIPYGNSVWCQKSVFVRINPYVWQHWYSKNLKKKLISSDICWNFEKKLEEYWAYQSAEHAALDKDSKDSHMQEMRRRKGKVGIHSVRVSGVGKIKDVDFGLCQDESETNKRGEAEWDRGPW